MGIGAAVVVDMYFMHERGKYMGFFVVFVTNGAHLAGVVGGFAAKDIGWRWCFWIPAIILGITWLVLLFGLPETLYHRDNKTGHSLQQPNQPWIKLLTFNGVQVKRKLRLWDFTHVFYMLKYPSVLLPAFYYSISFGLGSVLFAVTGAAVFNGIYDFDTAQVGMAIGLPTFIGTLLGEISAGPVSDRILYLYRKTHGGEVKPEARLQGTWPGAFFIVAGVIIEGVTLQYKTHWSGPVMGIGIGAVGLQIVSTNIYAYITDVSRPALALALALLYLRSYSPLPHVIIQYFVYSLLTLSSTQTLPYPCPAHTTTSMTNKLHSATNPNLPRSPPSSTSAGRPFPSPWAST